MRNKNRLIQAYTTKHKVLALPNKNISFEKLKQSSNSPIMRQEKINAHTKVRNLYNENSKPKDQRR